MRRKKHSETIDSPDMTPMLDVVFIMLIFFIVTTTFVKESGVDWLSNSGGDNVTSEIKPLVVTIDESDTISLLGRTIDAEALRANIELAYAKSKKAGVVVKAHEIASTSILIKAVDQIKLAGISQVVVSKL
ncbi:ExbD/TolR family protein [Aliikangiella sp. IMCC44359]|uniref:ExbD/TolR family protein n=1 Tax=Aliikangiella sp. IMCC44359 TaxID=3459125 RepID=UPI00403B0382